jgi:hypothetical protein
MKYSLKSRLTKKADKREESVITRLIKLTQTQGRDITHKEKMRLLHVIARSNIVRLALIERNKRRAKK